MRYLAALLLLVGLAACKKEDPLAEDPTLSITTTEEIAMNNTDGTSMEVKIKYSGQGTPTVNMSISGLPDGVSATFDPQEGKGSFTTRVRFVADDLPAIAVYPVTITAAVGDGLSAQATTKLVINGEGDCNRFFIDHIHNQYPEMGTYVRDEDKVIWGGASFYYEQGTAELYLSNIRIGYLMSGTDPRENKKDVLVQTECADNGIYIPEQRVVGYTRNQVTGEIYHDSITVSGEGRFNYTDKTYYINYQSLTDGGAISRYTLRGTMK